MSPESPDSHRDSCAGDVAAYVLGSLEPAEAERFRRHLEGCPVCPDELRGFQQVIDDLAAATPRHATPRALRRRVLAEVAAHPHPAAAPAVPHRRRRKFGLALPRPALAFGGGGLALAAIVVALVLALGGSGGGGGARTYAAQVSGSGSAALQVSPDGHAALVLHHFPGPGRGRIYEVWLQRGSATAPTTALFSPNRDGDATVDVPGELHGVSHVLVTSEPAGGTRVPTRSPVITATPRD